MKYSCLLLVVIVLHTLVGMRLVFNKITYGTPGNSISITSSTIAGLSPGDTLQINPGTYTGFSMTGIHLQELQIMADGVTVSWGGGFSGATISSSSLFTLKGIYFYNGSYKGLQLDGNVDSCTIIASFRNFRDVVFYTSGLTYDGTAATRNNALDLQLTTDSTFGASVMHFGNTFWESHIHNCHIDSVIGTPIQAIEFYSGWHVYIHDNIFTKINMGGTNHNSIIYAAGQWFIYNNVVLDFQGECRLRPYTMDSTGTHKRDTSLFYNNFAWNSAKYGQAELQQFDADTNTNTTLPNVKMGDVLVFNNTAGRLRDVDFPGGGCQFTLEGFKGHGKIWNNAVVCPRTDADQSGLTAIVGTVINNAAGTLGRFDTSHNRFFLTFAASGLLDSTTGKISSTSPLVNAGVTVTGPGVPSIDADGRTRPQGAAWDIGRSEAILNSVGPRVIKKTNRLLINQFF